MIVSRTCLLGGESSVSALDTSMSLLLESCLSLPVKLVSNSVGEVTLESAVLFWLEPSPRVLGPRSSNPNDGVTGLLRGFLGSVT